MARLTILLVALVVAMASAFAPAAAPLTRSGKFPGEENFVVMVGCLISCVLSDWYVHVVAKALVPRDTRTFGGIYWMEIDGSYGGDPLIV